MAPVRFEHRSSAPGISAASWRASSTVKYRSLLPGIRMDRARMRPSASASESAAKLPAGSADCRMQHAEQVVGVLLQMILFPVVEQRRGSRNPARATAHDDRTPANRPSRHRHGRKPANHVPAARCSALPPGGVGAQCRLHPFEKHPIVRPAACRTAERQDGTHPFRISHCPEQRLHAAHGPAADGASCQSSPYNRSSNAFCALTLSSRPTRGSPLRPDRAQRCSAKSTSLHRTGWSAPRSNRHLPAGHPHQAGAGC